MKHFFWQSCSHYILQIKGFSNLFIYTANFPRISKPHTDSLNGGKINAKILCVISKENIIMTSSFYTCICMYNEILEWKPIDIWNELVHSNFL